MKKFFKKFKQGDSYVLTDQLALIFARQSGPYREGLEKAIHGKDYKALVDWCIDYNRDWDVVSLYCVRQCLALYQKRDDIDIAVDKEAVSLSKFIDCEQTCKQSNQRLIKARDQGYDPGVASVLFTAQRKISRILGDLPDMDSLQFAFGPGANVNVRKTTSVRWKLSHKPACSTNMVGIIDDVLAQVPAYTSLHSIETEKSWLVDVDVLPGELMFVPKNAKTHRSIIVEPSMNSLAQKAYGTHMKTRLMAAGVNLYDQSVNRRRARIGSINGSLMTIDLSSASDTISRELVADLLPLDWYMALSRCRTSHIVYKKGDVDLEFKLEKFSSMGNGFTFELESLIFYALTWACCHEVGINPDVSVFGDDIICPPEALDVLRKVFEFCGFSINLEKSYHSGPFRESCGADFYKGVNVRPFYQKTSWSSATLTAFHNFLVTSDWSLVVPEAVEYLLQALPTIFHSYGPPGFGDGHLVGDWSPVPVGRDRGWSGFHFTTFIQKQRRVKCLLKGDSCLPHYVVYLRMSDEEPFDPFVVRGECGEKKIRVYTLGRF